ncbi:MAG: hypothetical protein WBW16_15305 [Bacteroidota bacterium]
MKPAICFIDNEKDEIDRFCRYLDKWFVIGAGTSVKQAMDELKNRHVEKPNAFIFDLYFSDGATSVKDPDIFLSSARAKFVAAETELYEALSKLRQTADGGFACARTVAHMKKPIIFFTRKGTIDNAIRAYETENAATVIKKPDPPAGKVINASHKKLMELYDAEFEKRAHEIAEKIERAIDRSKWFHKYKSELIGAGFGAIITAVFFILSKIL